MGYGIRNGAIRTYWPDNTETMMYLSDTHDLSEILEKIQEKWPGESFKNFSISAEQIHTDCIGYDLHDSSDWTDFIVIEKKSS